MSNLPFTIDICDLDDVDAIKFSASVCYQPSITEAFDRKDKIQIEEQLYDPHHHTTMEHAANTYSFIIDKVPVSLVTFGLHATHPFYNTSQRSGRYCRSMFSNNDEYINEFVDTYFSLDNDRLLKWVHQGEAIFDKYLPEITDAAHHALNVERPYFIGNIDTQAKRIAQEQLRVVLSTITPTALVYTVDIITLISMWNAAWNTPLNDILGRMVDIATAGTKLEFLKTKKKLWAPYTYQMSDTLGNLRLSPKCVLKNKPVIDCSKLELLHKDIDLLHFHPKINEDLSLSSLINTEVDMSIMTYGQDQRHRTIWRSTPRITGNYYAPPLLIGNRPLLQEMTAHFSEFFDLVKLYGSPVMHFFTPYGIMVKYEKIASPSAWYHSQKKRKCNNAQGEISELEKQLDQQLADIGITDLPDVPCKTAKCPEGKRFCGRDLSKPVSRKLI